MGDSSSDENAKNIGNKARVRRRRKIIQPNATEFCQNGNENSDDECAIYTSLRKKSTNFERKIEQTVTSSELQTIIMQKRNQKRTPNDSEPDSTADAVCSPPKWVKHENRSEVCFDSDEEKQLEANKEKARLKELQKFEKQFGHYDNEGLTESVNCSDISNTEIVLNGAYEQILPLLSAQESPSASKFKLFFKFGDKSKSLLVTGSERLEELLLQTGFDFQVLPTVYTQSSDPNHPELNVIPVQNYVKSVRKLGFKHLSIIHCYCMENFQDGHNKSLVEWYGKVIITFKVNEKLKFQFYSEPSEPFWKTIDKFETSQKGKLNLDGAKYCFDGDVIDVKSTPEILEMESGDIIDVYLDSCETN
ncbi:uncharacterized protein LOC142351104 [Convolutriloba macropyga]|uniref:uncharacterized protein LOC142351104 n=1 Tax=Convolutriloba macropyga TaxID=536237 RepID=UPI003F51FBCE